ncbi:MAG: outer membrane beta-barrel protein [Bacteroidota bacterium]
MKSIFKFFTLALFITLTSVQLSAQDMQSGARYAQAGIGLGGWADYTSQTPIISLSYMQGIKDDFLNGQLAVGGSIGYKSASYVSAYNYQWDWNYTFISGRATWHPNFMQSDKFDAYAGLGLGYLIVSVKTTGDLIGVEAVGASQAVLTGIIGARYAFNENWGAYAEIGNNLGYLTLGASYRF